MEAVLQYAWFQRTFQAYSELGDSVIRRLQSSIILFSMVLLGGLLTLRAARVQGAEPLVSCAGMAIGAVLGILLILDRTNFEFAGAILGTLLGLQFFTCYPDDGSNFVMPFVGAFVGCSIGWLIDRYRCRMTRH